ncbi:hypothetical protein TA3x_002431 [Tundrisphaera sp. TA3]|uniref:hypothetical protein n=1 Tax=Tundrisphaera sp. TA3 TaxID=3435775 RepID=UPI003EB9188C
MDGDELFRRMRDEVIGRPISFVRLVCDILLLYVDCDPGDGRGLTFWLNPPWEVSSPEGVVADSSQARSEDEEGPTEEQLGRVSTPIRGELLGRPITELQVDRRTRSMTMNVAGGHVVRVLASDPEDDHLWHLRENATGLTLYASTRGWIIRDAEE